MATFRLTLISVVFSSWCSDQLDWCGHSRPRRLIFCFGRAGVLALHCIPNTIRCYHHPGSSDKGKLRVAPCTCKHGSWSVIALTLRPLCWPPCQRLGVWVKSSDPGSVPGSARLGSVPRKNRDRYPISLRLGSVPRTLTDGGCNSRRLVAAELEGNQAA